MSQHDRARVRTPLLGVLVIASAAGLVAMGVTSCRRRRRLAQYRPMSPETVPTIRVRLTPLPVESADISTTSPCRILAGGPGDLRLSEPLRPALVRLAGGTWHIAGQSIEADHLEIVTDPPGRVRLGSREYRGSLRLLAVGDGRFLVVGHVNLESYLAGVLPEELYAHWSLQAYRALAVAARTFAMYQMRNFGASHDYDLDATQRSQVYGGFSSETEKAWRAVRSTHGQVLAYGPAGDERVFLAQYSACCGGIVNDAGVLRGGTDIPPLRGGQRCDDCRACSRYRWAAVTVSKRDLYDCLAATYGRVRALQGLARLRVTERTSYGRAVWVEAVDPDGRSARLRFSSIRTALFSGGLPAARKLHSMNCRIRDLGQDIQFYDGRGFGHGVGLCQWGAEGKARKGSSAEQMLEFYYPGATIIRPY